MSHLRAQYIGLLPLRGYTQRTKKSYVNAVEALSRHYGHSPHLLSDEQVRDYLLGLHQRGLRRSTINVAISALRVFYGSMLKRVVARNEECLARPRKVTRRSRVYSREELRTLFDETQVIKGGCPTLARIARLPASILQKHEAMQPCIMRCLDAGPVRLGKPFGWHAPIDGFCGGL